MAAITAVLTQFSEDVIARVTHPVTGLPTKKSWLPTVKEVFDACEETAAPALRQQMREKQVAELAAEREAIEAQRGQVRPTMAQLKEKYGENWGLEMAGHTRTADQKADENQVAKEREIERVAREYEEMGMKAPSKLALSPTALRVIAEQNELRAAFKSLKESGS